MFVKFNFQIQGFKIHFKSMLYFPIFKIVSENSYFLKELTKRCFSVIEANIDK